MKGDHRNIQDMKDAIMALLADGAIRTEKEIARAVKFAYVAPILEALEAEERISFTYHRNGKRVPLSWFKPQ